MNCDKCFYHVNLCNKQTNRPHFLCSLAFLKCFCIYLLYCGEWSFATTMTTWRSGDKFQWSVPSFHCVESREEMQVTRFNSMHLYPLSKGLLGYFTCGTISDNLKESSLSPFPPQTLRCYCSTNSSNTAFAGYFSLLTRSTTNYVDGGQYELTYPPKTYI